MKKIRYILFFILVVLVIVSVINLLIYFLWPTNTDFQINVESVKILPLDQYQIDYLTDFDMFEDIAVNKEITKGILSNTDDFMVVEIAYCFNNYSETIDMVDLRINYDFSDILKDRVVAYNDGHTVINIFLEHGKTFKITQRILLDVSDMSETEITEAIHQSDCIVSYFTGPFNHSDGQRFKGPGKKTVYYPMHEIIGN